MTYPSAVNGQMMARADTDPIRVTTRIPYAKTILLSTLHRCGRTTRSSVRSLGPVKEETEGKEEKKNYYSSSNSSDSSDSK